MEVVTAVIIICVVALLMFAWMVWNSASSKRSSSDTVTAEQKPRLSLPTDENVYVFSMNSELTAAEWQTLFNAGWTLVTSNTEQYEDYAGCYPEAPKFHRTRWHYVFRKENVA